MLAGSLVAEFDPPMVAKPTERPLDNVAGLAEAAAVRLVLATPLQQRLDPHGDHCRNDPRKTVSGISLKDRRLAAGRPRGP